MIYCVGFIFFSSFDWDDIIWFFFFVDFFLWCKFKYDFVIVYGSSNGIYIIRVWIYVLVCCLVDDF